MDIRSDRRWHFDAPRPEVWKAFTRVDDYGRWWPWLRACDAERFEVGACWRCVVQPPVPYTLRIEITLVEVVAHELVRALVGGDIVGSAELTLRDAAPFGASGPSSSGRSLASEARLVSALAPANPLMTAVARFVRPLATFGHDWVLDTGARQFRRSGLGDEGGR